MTVCPSIKTEGELTIKQLDIFSTDIELPAFIANRYSMVDRQKNKHSIRSVQSIKLLGITIQ